MRKNWLEWIVFGVGLLLVGGTISYLAYQTINSKDTLPALRIELGTPVARGALYYVPATVYNEGDVTAEAVNVEVTLTPPKGDEETAEFEVQFLPRNSQRQGWVTFSDDPSGGRLSARVKGFEEP